MNDVFADNAISLSMLKMLAENSFDSILVTDASKSGRIIYANRAFTKLTGHSPADVIGKTPRILQGRGTDPKVIARLPRLDRAKPLHAHQRRTRTGNRG
jgi:PAS domain S-box-containing protein